MPRYARTKSSTGIYHIILRGNNKDVIFKDYIDHVRFLETVEKFKETSGYVLYGYCLMKNHVHLLIKEGDEGISHHMRRIGTSYVRWYNQKYDRIGHLFQDRYKSENVENDRYLLTLIRYIHQNPIKAGIAEDCHSYPWSSYASYVESRQSPYVSVDTSFILGIFHEYDPKSLPSFVDFHQARESEASVLDVPSKIKYTDVQLRELICSVCNLSSVYDLKKLPRADRDRCLSQIKDNEGVTTRQISRVTAIGKYIVVSAGSSKREKV